MELCDKCVCHGTLYNIVNVPAGNEEGEERPVCDSLFACVCVTLKMRDDSVSAGPLFVCVCVYIAMFQLSEWIRLRG